MALDVAENGVNKKPQFDKHVYKCGEQTYLDEPHGLLLVHVVEGLACHDIGSAAVHLQRAHSRHNHRTLQIVCCLSVIVNEKKLRLRNGCFKVGVVPGE